MTTKYTKISQLREGDKQSIIKVAIIRKGNTEDYNTAQGCEKLLKLILIDKEVKIFNLLVSVILI